jgi:Fusaric acid resistance protein-like
MMSDSHSAQPARAHSHVAVSLLATLVIIAPVLVLSLTPFNAQASLAFAGVLPAVAAVRFGWRVALAATAAAATLLVLALLVTTHPILSTALMVLVGLGIGAAATRGWQSIATVASIEPAMMIVDTPEPIAGSGWESDSPGQILVLAGIAILGGLWVIAAASLLLRGVPPKQPTPLPSRTSWIFGVGMAILLGVTTFIAATWFYGTTAAWMILTILVVARPEPAESKTRIVERTAGTIAGGVLAAGIAYIVDDHTVVVILGVAALFVAVAALLTGARYAYFAIAVTAAIVLIESSATEVFEIALQRVLFTLTGAILAALLLAAFQIVLSRRGGGALAGEPR